MGMGGRGTPPKVLCVYGTEGGTAKRGIEKLKKSWEKRGATWKMCGVVEGNSIASQLKDGTLKDKYDVLIISTSSFGEGDPPDNFKSFLLELYRAQKAQLKPLEGMQHAVLGYGASVYDTFQNVPRLTDKLLGECGSRRFARRCELDEGVEDDTVAKMQSFEDEVFNACRDLPSATTKPVCEWTFPEKQVLEKSESDLQMDSIEAGSFGIGIAVAVLVAAAGYAYSQGYL